MLLMIFRVGGITSGSLLGSEANCFNRFRSCLLFVATIFAMWYALGLSFRFIAFDPACEIFFRWSLDSKGGPSKKEEKIEGERMVEDNLLALLAIPLTATNLLHLFVSVPAHAHFSPELNL